MVVLLGGWRERMKCLGGFFELFCPQFSVVRAEVPVACGFFETQLKEPWLYPEPTGVFLGIKTDAAKRLLLGLGYGVFKEGANHSVGFFIGRRNRKV